MATDSTKILVGAGTAYIGDYVAAAGAATLVDVGHTHKPVSYAPEFKNYDVESERAFGVIKSSPVDAMIKVTVPMMETTAQNLRIAMRQPSANISGSAPNNTILVGDPKEQYHQIKISGPGPGTNKARDIFFWKCQVESMKEVGIAKGDVQVYDVVFRVLYDDSVATADKFFKQVDS